MKDGICLRCGSDEVYDDLTKVIGHGHRDILAITAFLNCKIQNYVCLKCGYLESYIEDNRDKRDDIRESWHRTSKRKRKNDEA